jgi:8-oxo-dGTP pyrophosphatase MutT (NUDIX family)
MCVVDFNSDQPATEPSIMSVSRFSTTQLFAEEFVESAGAIIFHFSTMEVCLVFHREHGEWLLPKGRRNCGESRHNAALREACEETGYTCSLLPVTMKTRAPPSDEEYPDEARQYEDLVEPFAVTTRQLGERNAKFIWWYIVAVDEAKDRAGTVHVGDEIFEAMFFTYATAVEKLTYELDQTILRRAVDLVSATYHQASAT